MSARAVAVIRPAPTIIALTAFLFILSGQSSCTLLRSNPLESHSAVCRLLGQVDPKNAATSGRSCSHQGGSDFQELEPDAEWPRAKASRICK